MQNVSHSTHMHATLTWPVHTVKTACIAVLRILHTPQELQAFMNLAQHRGHKNSARNAIVLNYSCLTEMPMHMSWFPGKLLLVPRSCTILGGTPVRIYGPCAEKPEDIKCVFDTEEVKGKYYPDQGQFVCVTPRFQKTGRVQFTLTFTSNTGEKQTHSSIFSVGETIYALNPIILWDA